MTDDNLEWYLLLGAVNRVLKQGVQREAEELQKSIDKARRYRKWLKFRKPIDPPENEREEKE